MLISDDAADRLGRALTTDTLPSRILALALFVPRIGIANHHHAPMTANDFAVIADPLHAWLDLHCYSSATLAHFPMGEVSFSRSYL